MKMDYDVMSTTVTAVRLEVYMSQPCYVHNLRVLAHHCARNFTPVEIHVLRLISVW